MWAGTAIQELERQRLNISFDEQINYNRSLASLDFAPLQSMQTAKCPTAKWQSAWDQ